ncbi:negative regulation of toll-like receptor 5 signaling pathway [Branchiostoma belcheri]|nr:negative regulation of toll-like receptor 5 signaling pathway [Branchiostoma belcheri]
METVNKMPRSPSFVDTEKSRQLWDLILDSIQSGNDVTGAEVCYLGAMTGHSLMLPCVSLFPQNFQEILNKQLIDRFMQKTLEEAKVLNWCRVSRPLTPVQTTGDGNCLLHAVSQYMWGIHDRALALRRLLNRTMVADMTEDMKRRWNRSCKAHNQHVDLEYASLEWRQEWNIVVSMTDPTPNPPEANDLPYKSLEEFHIFVLANLLRRPIIILAEDVLHNFEGHTFAPIHFSGIYLPLRWKPEECVRSPIVLGYLQQHFTPLLSQEEAPAPIGLATGEFAVPLVKHDLTMLTVQFLLEHEETQAKELLQKYLDLMELPYTRKESISMVLAAKLNLNPPPEEQDFIKDFFQAVEKFYKKPEKIQEAAEPEKVAQNKIPPPAVKKEKTEAGKEGKKCSSAGCDMYGTPEQNGLCTKCFRESTVSKKPPGPAEAPAVPADVVPNSSMLMRECRTPGCQYFCSIATGEYCHECYEKNTGDQRRREVEAGRATQTAKEVQPPAGNPNKCITEGCNNDRNPDYENLCDVCFINVVTKSGQPPSVHPLKQTERSSSLGIIPTTPEPLHSVENRTNSQSLGHISDFTHPTKCIIPECPRTGYPKTNDMCKKCYIDQQGRVAGAVAAAVTTVAAVLTHLSSTFTSAKTSTPGGSPTCKTVGCEMFGAPGQDGYCSQCYLMELGKKSRPKPAVEIAATQQTVATAPQRPTEEVHPIVTVNDVTKAKYYKKCKTPDCQKIGHENANGLCHECYPKDSNTGRIPDKSAAATNLLSSGPEELVPTGAEGSTNPQISTQSETRPLGFEMSSSSTLPLGPIDPQTGDNNSTECLIEGCTNMKLENTGGRCYWCLKKGKIPQTPKATTKAPTAPSSSSDPPAAASTNIGAAAAAADPQPPQPIPSLVNRKQCPAPHCDAFGDAMYNGLCSKCFHTLQEYHSKKPAALPSPLPNGPHHSSEELPANTIITAGHGASVVVTPGNVTVTTEEGGTVSVARTTTQVPDEPQLPCVNAAQGCEMFGTKEQMGFCFQCFGKHINQQVPVNQPPQPPVNHPPQPANQHQGETPLRVLAEVAGASHYAARLPRQRCIAPGCDMHGEPENLNMCSKCYLRHLAEVHRAKDIEAHRAQNLHTNVEPPAAYPPRIIHATVQTGPYYPPPAYNPVVPEPQPTYAPPAYHNRQPCATPNCPNDGHPDQENLCAPCFQKFMSLMTPQQAATKWEPQAAYQKYVTQQQTKSSALKNCVISVANIKVCNLLSPV